MYLLFEYQTVNPFVREFYELILRELETADALAPDLCDAFAEFLDVEIRRHHLLSMKSNEEPKHGEELLEMDEETRVEFETIARRLEKTSAAPCEIPRRLLIAECHYYLRHTKRVLREVQAAMVAGCKSPLLAFSLGYNLFDLAVKEQVSLSPDGRRHEVGDSEAFLARCFEAIEAFLLGIRGKQFDAQILYWVGHMAELIGAHDSARLAYEKCAQRDAQFTKLADQKTNELSEPRASAFAVDPECARRFDSKLFRRLKDV